MFSQICISMLVIVNIALYFRAVEGIATKPCKSAYFYGYTFVFLSAC